MKPRKQYVAQWCYCAFKCKLIYFSIKTCSFS